MSPLIKRLPRELAHNIGKYLGILLLMAVSIALTSGFLLAAHSISVIIDDMPETYVIEDGRFTTAFEATDEQLDAVRDAASDSGGIELYKNYSFDTSFEKTQGDNARNCTVRTFEHRTQVDLAAYAQGGEPQAADEIAIDRVFATNNDVSMGDTVALNGVEFHVVGIMTLADNQALFQSNSDFTVNTLSFGVAEVSSEGFKALENTGFLPSYTYSYRFADRDLSVADRVDIEKDMVSALSDAHANVTDLTDVDSNQGIGYAKDDVSGDSAMWTTLLYIIIVIMAFVFVVLTSGTIEEESAIIGTLLASGYRRRELVAHYLALPCIVGIAAAAVGNVVGFTLMSEPMRNLYYGSQPASVLCDLELGRFLPDHRCACGGFGFGYACRLAAQDGSHAPSISSPRNEQGRREAWVRAARAAELHRAIPLACIPAQFGQLCHAVRGHWFCEPAVAVLARDSSHDEPLRREFAQYRCCAAPVFAEGAVGA